MKEIKFMLRESGRIEREREGRALDNSSIMLKEVESKETGSKTKI